MNKIYILVHSWLAPANRAVQAAHVVQGWAAAEKDMHIILLETGKSQPQDDLKTSIHVCARLNKYAVEGTEIPTKHFTESKECNGGQITAVGFILDPNETTPESTNNKSMLLHLSKFRLAS